MASGSDKRSEKLKRLVAVQRHLEKMADSELRALWIFFASLR